MDTEEIKKEVKEFAEETLKEDDTELGIIDTTEDRNIVRKVKYGSMLKGVCIAEFCIILFMFVWNLLLFFIPKKELKAVIIQNALTGEQTIHNQIQDIEKYTTPEYLSVNTVKTYITNLRSVSSDIYVSQENMKKVYAYSTEKAVQKAESYFKEFNPIERQRKDRERVAVVIYNATPINTADKSFMKFQVDWQETTYSEMGKIKEQKNYRADITAKQFRATRQTSEINPLGFYITDFIVSEIKNGFITKGEAQ